MIRIKHKGSFKNTEKFFKRNITQEQLLILEKYAHEGVVALASSTPYDTGETASSWGYKISIQNRSIKIIFTNSHVVNNVPIAIILQYGHATKDGGYVQGLDYINPAIRPVFNKIVNELQEVIK